MKRVRIETGFFSKPTPKPVRVRLARPDVKLSLIDKQEERVHELIQEEAPKRKLPRNWLSEQIFQGTVVGYSAKPKRAYLPDSPHTVMMDALWLARGCPTLLWATVMLAAAEAIKELLDEQERNR